MICLLVALAAAMRAFLKVIKFASRSDGLESLYTFSAASMPARDDARGSSVGGDCVEGESAATASAGGGTCWNSDGYCGYVRGADGVVTTGGVVAAGFDSAKGLVGTAAVVVTARALSTPASARRIPFTSSSVSSNLCASGAFRRPAPNPGPPRCLRSNPWRVRVLRRMSSSSLDPDSDAGARSFETDSGTDMGGGCAVMPTFGDSSFGSISLSGGGAVMTFGDSASSSVCVEPTTFGRSCSGGGAGAVATGGFGRCCCFPT
mmetsp:Transcript_728/g.1681  ORF Transcript_728/g.1681 Transcript_728/m.1681 type:complete len:262 (-) Transcript_728:1096-1881(-)